MQAGSVTEAGGGQETRGRKALREPPPPRALNLPLSRRPRMPRPRRAQRLPFLEALHDLTTSGLSAGEAVRLLSVRLKEPALRAL